MHADELELDEPLVRRLLAEQFPQWADRPLQRIEPSGTDNAIFRLGEDLSLRLPRRRGPMERSWELDWLPRLAPLLPLEIPVPVAPGRASDEYPCLWDVYTWVEGETVPVEEIDAVKAARDLAAFVAALQRVDPAGAPQGRGIPLSERDAEVRPGWRRGRATRGWRRSGSVRSPSRRGMAHLSGTTATSTCATGSCGTAASPR